MSDKVVTLRRLVTQYGRIAFIDDLPVNLDAFRSAGLTAEEVMTLQINRENGRVQEQSPNHLQVKTLSEANDIIFA